MSNHPSIQHTINWVKSVVIGLNFCPFAAKTVIQNSIRYAVLQPNDIKETLSAIQSEFELLDKDNSIETILVIFPDDFKDFQSYLSLVKKAEKLITTLNYDGVYQIASFHPDYCFAGSDKDDAANYTNRSPYPMLHLLREESLSKALATFKNPESIPERNVNLAREKGLKYMQVLRAACFDNMF